MKSYKFSDIQAKETFLQEQTKSLTYRNNKSLSKINCFFGLLLSLVIFTVFLISCNKDVPDQPSDIPALNSLNRDSLGMGNLGSVIYTVDPSRMDTATFDPSSESNLTLFVTDANGYEWMLSIPPHVLMESQLITMTAFSTIDASHTVARIRSGVQLGSDGMQFLDKVFLSVNTPDEKPGTAQFFTFNQDGSHVEFAETSSWESGGGGLAKIWHFSGAAYDDSQKSGKDVMDLYSKCAKEDLELGLIAAKQFLENPTPTPPEAPSISQFCRNFNKDQVDVELYEYMHYFIEPYEDITKVILNSLYQLQLLGDDPNTIDGYAACLKIMQKAEQSLYKLAKTYEGKKPPDQLYAMINLGLYISKSEELLSMGAGSDLQSKSMFWAQTIRDYYLDTELKKNHDYRAFPVLLWLNKEVQFLEGTDRFEEIWSAMTFKLTIDTKFYYKQVWASDDKAYLMGNVVQHADIKMTNNPMGEIWGDIDNLALHYTSGSFKHYHFNGTGTSQADGLTYNGTVWLKNWDPCLTNTFDMMISDFDGAEINSVTYGVSVASGSAMVCFADHRWPGAGMAYMFTVPIHNLNKTLGDTTFTASGSAMDGGVTGNGEVHIKIEHTPE